jgi:hypothetical protein
MATTTVETLSSQSKIVSIALAAAETSAPVFVGGICTVTALPGGGGTMTVQTTTSRPSLVTAGTATWINWTAGAAAANTQAATNMVTAVRATATTQPGTFEVMVGQATFV